MLLSADLTSELTTSLGRREPGKLEPRDMRKTLGDDMVTLILRGLRGVCVPYEVPIACGMVAMCWAHLPWEFEDRDR